MKITELKISSLPVNVYLHHFKSSTSDDFANYFIYGYYLPVMQDCDSPRGKATFKIEKIFLAAIKCRTLRRNPEKDFGYRQGFHELSFSRR